MCTMTNETTIFPNFFVCAILWFSILWVSYDFIRYLNFVKHGKCTISKETEREKHKIVNSCEMLLS